MRIAGTSYTDSMVSHLNLLSAQEYQLQNEASTDQSISAPEDDPAGMAAALNLQAQNSAVTQYAQNITTLQTRTTTAGSALTSLQTLTDRASEIATSADGATSPAALQADATEVTQLIQQAAQLMNSKNGSQYVFGGTDSSQAPFTVSTDANGNVTAVTYSGNTDVTQSQIAANATMSVDVPGENTSGSGARGVVSDSRYGADLFNHLIALQNDLQSGNTSAITSTDAANLSKDDDNIIWQVANNGAAQSRLTAAASFASTQQSGLQTSLTNVAGADLAQTLTQLTQAQNAYQVALQTSSQILQMQQSVLSSLS
jgi:flagellar hook-associated protein 3 FlgL